MFRIRRVHDDLSPANKRAIEAVQAILLEQFPDIRKEEISRLPQKLREHVRFGFQSMLFAGEGARGRVKGFALVLYDPSASFCYLDWIAAAGGFTGRGIGGALYERVRDEAAALRCTGLFLECLPDDPRLCAGDAILKQNVSRLRFYERYGARPVIGTKYETPLQPGEDCPPYLVFDGLGNAKGLPLKKAKKAVRAILEKKYGEICPREYREMVIDSFKDDPVRLRDAKYVIKPAPAKTLGIIPPDERIHLVVNGKHAIHHVRERGYVEAPARIGVISSHLERTGLFQTVSRRHFGDSHILSVHDGGFVEYLKRVCLAIPDGESVYPYVFPVRNAARPPKELPLRAGYYCIDTFTPLTRNAYRAAREGVDCALTGAKLLIEGARLSYALVRPPGHHAEKRVFGGFCYFNNAAIAAHFLSRHGKVCILDIDYHHGNGQQDIFWERDDVLTVSIHGHPGFAYPYFSGFDDEKGSGAGRGFNLNIPLPENTDGNRYEDALDRALKRVARFSPDFLVVCLGMDTSKGDPTGSWSLTASDFESNGRAVGSVGVPTLVVQEGGYNTKTLGPYAARFFKGLWGGSIGL